jgi:trans-aconitate methyltransferase
LGREPRREPHKFDPANVAKLERPERQRILPNERIVGLLELGGSETVVDYGAGSGVLSVPVARGLPEGVVHAVDESPEMIEHLRRRLEETGLANFRAWGESWSSPPTSRRATYRSPRTPGTSSTFSRMPGLRTSR